LLFTFFRGQIGRAHINKLAPTTLKIIAFLIGVIMRCVRALA